jgi:hypothetical protein
MVEVEANIVRILEDRFITGELELFNEVFVGELSETAAFISVKEDVINPEGCVEEVTWGT